MMILERLFPRRRRAGPDLESLQHKLQALLRPSLVLVDSRDLTIPAKRQRLALYLFGAAAQLAGEHDMDETRALALLVMVLKAQPGMHEREVSNLVAVCVNRHEQPETGAVVEAGAQAMRQWLAGDAGSAVSGLAAALARRTD